MSGLRVVLAMAMAAAAVEVVRMLAWLMIAAVMMRPVRSLRLLLRRRVKPAARLDVVMVRWLLMVRVRRVLGAMMAAVAPRLKPLLMPIRLLMLLATMAVAVPRLRLLLMSRLRIAAMAAVAPRLRPQLIPRPRIATTAAAALVRSPFLQPKIPNQPKTVQTAAAFPSQREKRPKTQP